jgi:6-methylsalicylate decarboxylase
MLVDVHQHIWTEPLLDRLSARRLPPLVRRADGHTVVHSVLERPYRVDPLTESAERRGALVRSDGLDLALVALSSPIGIEALPAESAIDLIDAHLEGVEALGPEFAVWGPVALDDCDATQVDRLVQRGCAGVSIPAGALALPERLERIGGVLARAAELGAPVFVHPGPDVGDLRPEASLTEPTWWRPLTDYVAQMQAAWLAFVTHGRREHPELAIVFSMLAGGAPLLSERLDARGGPPIDLRDPRTFYDTSSYGPAAVAMMARRVGGAQLLYGSDRPVVDPSISPGVVRCGQNAQGLLAAIGALG